jgi:transcriptional regulator with GAF, ATPase, and Fis domain
MSYSAATEDIFHQATLRICGNLKIEKALQSTLKLLQKVMPVDEFYLEFYDPQFKAMRTIAKATATNYEALNLLTSLSSPARESASIKDLPDGKNVFIFDKPWERAISREMLKYHNAPSTSLIALMLKTDDEFLGVLILNSIRKVFTEKHAEIISDLRDPFCIAMSNALKHRELKVIKDLLADDNRFLHRELHRISGEDIVGDNFGLREVMQQVMQVAPLDSPVLLTGETGVGKDVIANAIHYSSARSKEAFISVNCGAIPESLIDSELFGHEKGAFTGAIAQKKGRFERANKGTIFLDEIGELPLEAQVRLLRVLQTKEIERVGGTQTIHLDIRVIAATNRDLEELVENGKFREDLWFRLNVFPVRIPPLRERKADIPALLQHFITTKSKELKLPSIPSLSPLAVDTLLDYHWPGNVRELQNIVERALILNPKGPLRFDTILGNPRGKAGRKSGKQTDNLDEIISTHIKSVLNKTSGKIHGSGGAAELLGVNANTLRNRMNKLGRAYGRKNV